MAETATARRKPDAEPYADIVGQVRRFGPRGGPYEVLRVVSSSEALIRVITTGEETTYPISDVLSDPED